MAKEKRSGAESKRSKPFLDVRVYEPISKKLTIMRESDAVLRLYTSFKNDQNKVKSITEDSIIDALIGTLENDQEFIEWKLKIKRESTGDESTLVESP
ncbi:hypothetical protein [Fluviispira sanaruensis]|uniref:Uncharacterized protein n=1 Tax=Fluviispira sanaruensis TaxID=2493639 RepID=A0A4P2VYF5_FLUSA|nr:hypothetical protein [Fluviispira sanaruensis]BBH54735.1 hypothetical protein JCM31447_32090 [Fluviispira sanaruensis]